MSVWSRSTVLVLHHNFAQRYCVAGNRCSTSLSSSDADQQSGQQGQQQRITRISCVH
jgi:hypothetical protein